jgi:uroporphyrinogen-III synthase
VLYRTVPARAADPQGARLLREGRIDGIAFASGSAAHGFAALFGSEAGPLASHALVTCMGRTCAADARSAGLRVDAVADGGLPELVSAVESLLSKAGPRDPP